MSVHYKFKSTIDFDTITFDGLHISVGDLKKAIIHQKRLGKITDFDLQITNAQTKEEYNDDLCLIPKNTSLVIARIPLSHQLRKPSEPLIDRPLQTRSIPKADAATVDLLKMKGSEEDKIQAMMLQSTADYDPKSYQRIRGQSQTGEVPSTYRCNKCKKGGHWIKNCPLIVVKEHMDMKRTTGIPRSFRDKADKGPEAETPEPLPLVEKEQKVPEDLICSICNDLFVDAVMIPCCGSSFCDDCVRTALLESEDNECPDCKEKGSSPGSLIPNRFLRNSVNAFKNETGYKPLQLKKVSKEVSSPLNKPEDIEEENAAGTEVEPLKQQTPDQESLKDTTADSGKSKSDPNVTIESKKTKLDESAKESKELPVNEKVENETESPSHNEIESDYEDNITITMPPAPVPAFQERSHNGRHSRHPKPPGIDNSPRNPPHTSSYQSSRESHRDTSHRSTPTTQQSDWDRHSDRNGEYRDQHQNPSSQSSNVPMHYQSGKFSERARPVNPHEIYPAHRSTGFPHVPTHPQLNQVPPMPGPPMGSFDNMYNQIGPRPGMGYPPYVRPLFHNPRPGYVPMRGQPENFQALPSSNLVSVYQGVAAKVGTGIIDDPLEVFNRIMKEKEKRKNVDRRRSPEGRRSRSIDIAKRNRFRTSPHDRRGIRDPHSREKQLRSRRPQRSREREREREHERLHVRERGHDRSKYMRQRRSKSFSDRSSRSKSRSTSQLRKRSKSPTRNRRSRSRPSPSGERFRQIEKHRPIRRENEFRHNSPRQSTSRRSRSHERPHMLQHPNWNLQNPSLTTFDGDRSFRRDERRPYERSTNSQSKQDVNLHSDKALRGLGGDAILEMPEPPPPGYEPLPAAAQSNHWANSELIRSTTPDLWDRNVSSHLEETKENKERARIEERSWSITSRGRSEKKRKHAHSVSPTKTSAAKPEKTEHLVHKRSRMIADLQRERGDRDDDFVGRRLERERKHEREPERVKDVETHRSALRSSSEAFDSTERLAKKCRKPDNSETKAIEHQEYKPDKKSHRSPKPEDWDRKKLARSASKDTDKAEKRSKERKKKKKEKSERKKLKKEKKDKRERGKNKEIVEESSLEDSKINSESGNALCEQMEIDDKPKTPKTPDIFVETGIVSASLELKLIEENELAEEINLGEEREAAEDVEEHASTTPVKEMKDISDKAEAKNEDDTEIVEEGEIDDEYDNLKNQLPDKAQSNAASTDFNRSESFLDIPIYETEDFEDTGYREQTVKILPLVVPELSKWEREEQNVQSLHPVTFQDDNGKSVDGGGNKITNEVLRKAEKALFAKAINAIRPTEAKKVAGHEHQGPDSSHTPPSYRDTSKDNLKTIQIKVPISSSQERSVEIKDDSGKRSIKERLGSKIVSKIRFSPHRDTQTMQRHLAESNRARADARIREAERLNKDRDRYKDRDASDGRNRAAKKSFDGNDYEKKPRTNNHSLDYERRHGDTKTRRTDDSHMRHKSVIVPRTDREPVRESRGDKSHTRTGRDDRKKSGYHHDNKHDNVFETTRKSSSERTHRSRHHKNDESDSHKHTSRDSPKSQEHKKEITNKPLASSEPDWDSDSDEHKQKKTSRHKKDKKRARRSTSAESTASSKKKHSKERKKKKKKKSKK